MGWTPVAGAKINANNTSSAQITISVNAGELVVVGAITDTGRSSTTWNTPTDARGNAYLTPITNVNARPSVMMLSGAVVSTTESLAITVSNNTVVEFLHVFRFSHDGGTIPGTVNASGGNQTNSVNITTSVADALIIGCADATSSLSAGSGFTGFAIADVQTVRFLAEYETDLTNAAGSNTVAFTVGSNQGVLAVAWNPPSAAATKGFPFNRSPMQALLAM